MSDRVRRVLEALERIDYFGTANPDLATALPITIELFTINHNALAQLATTGITRESSTSLGKNETLTKTAIFNEIYADLRRIAQTAEILKRRNPDFANTYTLPRDMMSRAQLLDKAKAVHADSAAHEDDFFALGLSRTFRAELQADITALEAVSQSQADAKRSTVGANAAANAILEEALDNREILNRALRNHYRDSPQKLAEWLTACRIERAPQRTDEEQPEPPPTPPTPPG
jgi:hypothetical protein